MVTIFDITGGRYDEMYIGQSPSPQQPGANIRTHKMGWEQNSILQNSILHVWEWWPSKTRLPQVFQPAHITCPCWMCG